MKAQGDFKMGTTFFILKLLIYASGFFSLIIFLLFSRARKELSRNKYLLYSLDSFPHFDF